MSTREPDRWLTWFIAASVGLVTATTMLFGEEVARWALAAAWLSAYGVVRWRSQLSARQ